MCALSVCFIRIFVMLFPNRREFCCLIFASGLSAGAGKGSLRYIYNKVSLTRMSLSVAVWTDGGEPWFATVVMDACD